MGRQPPDGTSAIWLPAEGQACISMVQLGREGHEEVAGNISDTEVVQVFLSNRLPIRREGHSEIPHPIFGSRWGDVSNTRGRDTDIAPPENRPTQPPPSPSHCSARYASGFYHGLGSAAMRFASDNQKHATSPPNAGLAHQAHAVVPYSVTARRLHVPADADNGRGGRSGS